MTRRNAFTLVELLVVITIIGMLAAIITVAAGGARVAVWNGTVKTEMHQMEMALEQYKNQYGEYPPDFTDSMAVIRHIKKRWPRMVLTGANPVDQYNNVMSTVTAVTGWELGVTTDNPLEIKGLGLAFWLGGLPNKNKSTDPYKYASFEGMESLHGFANNPLDPFDPAAPQEKPVYDFQFGKNCAIIKTPGGKVFPVAVSQGLPVVYFRAAKKDFKSEAYIASTQAQVAFYSTSTDDWSLASGDLPSQPGIVTPYTQKLNSSDEPVWYNADSFQLIHPGRDGLFQVVPSPATPPPPMSSTCHAVVETQVGLTPRSLDNIVNFGSGSTLKALLP